MQSPDAEDGRRGTARRPLVPHSPCGTPGRATRQKSVNYARKMAANVLAYIVEGGISVMSRRGLAVRVAGRRWTIGDCLRVIPECSTGRKFDAHREDGRLPPAPWEQLANGLFRGRYRDSPLEMLKIKIEPAICMKTQAAMTKCPAKYTVFTRIFANCAAIDMNRSDFFAEMHRLCDKSWRSGTGVPPVKVMAETAMPRQVVILR